MGRKHREISWPEQQHDSVVITVDSTDDGYLYDRVSDPVKTFHENIGGLVFNIESDRDSPASCTYRFSFETAKEIEAYRLDFEEKTSTKWISTGAIYRGKSTLYHRRYLCKFSGKNLITPDANKRPQCSRSFNSNTGCTAQLVLRINAKTEMNWQKDKFLPDYPSEFILIGSHNHELNPVGPRRNLPVLRETMEQLKKMFTEKMTASQARHKQRAYILENFKRPESIQDTRYLPDERQFEYFWAKWRTEYYGTDWSSLLTIITDKYPSDPRIRVCTESNVVAIVTPLMERVHRFNPQSKEIAFIDSTSNTDMFQSTVTFILTASPIGGMPLGVIISDGKDEETYTKGFQLIKNMTQDYGFYGNGHPQIIMTDMT